MEFKRGQAIYRQGDEPKGLYFVEKGLIGLTIVGATSGREHLIRFFSKGQFFGHRALFSEEPYHATATALEPSIVRLRSKIEIFQELKEHPDKYKEIVLALCKELRRAETQHVMILENQILARTAQTLIYLKSIDPDHLWTRQEIANFCASTVSTVIKAMAELEEMGLISQKGREFKLLDQEGLLQLQE